MFSESPAPQPSPYPHAQHMSAKPQGTYLKMKLRMASSSTDMSPVSSVAECLSKYETFCMSSVRKSSRRSMASTFSPAITRFSS